MSMSGLLFLLLGMNVSSQTNQRGPSDNLALRGQAVQSTSFSNWIAASAIDTSLRTCSCTTASRNPWWRLDLLDSYYISTVVITNRLDCCPERLDGAEIHIGNSLENNGNNNTRCAVLYGVAAGQSVSVSCNNMKGRYVNVVIPGSYKILTICEVEVYQADMKKTFVMMKFLSSVNMTDPAVNNVILDQIENALTSKGLSNFTLTWTKLPQKVEPEIKLDGPCVKEPE